MESRLKKQLDKLTYFNTNVHTSCIPCIFEVRSINFGSLKKKFVYPQYCLNSSLQGNVEIKEFALIKIHAFQNFDKTSSSLKKSFKDK